MAIVFALGGVILAAVFIRLGMRLVNFVDTPNGRAVARSWLRLGSIWLLGLVLGFGALGVAAYVANPYILEGRYHLTTLRIDAHRDVVITGSTSWEVSEPIYYEFRVDRKAAHGPRVLGYVLPRHPPLVFELIMNDTRDLVAIIERADPNRVLAFDDSVSATPSPHDVWNGGTEAAYHAHVNRLLDRMRTECRLPSLVLSDESPGTNIE